MRNLRCCCQLSLLGVAVLTAAGCGDDSAPVRALSASSADDADVVLVRVVRPELTSLQRITTQPVTVSPYHEADIEAKVSGYLRELNVDIGDLVEQGDVLAVLDVPEMVRQRERQEKVILRLLAEEQRAVAEVALAAANVESAKASLAQSESDIQKAAANLKADEAEFRRIEQLVNSRSIEARSLDEGRQRYESAQAAKAAAEASVTSATANVKVAEASLASAKADVARAEAETAVARKELEEMDAMMTYASLSAPFSGVVTVRNVDLGDLVRNSQSSSSHPKPLLTIAQVDRVRIQVALPESDAPWATVGDEAHIRLSALHGVPLNGTISRVTRSLDASTRTMLAEIDLDNPDQRLLPGMYGEATIVLGEKSDVLVLPASAVRFDTDGKSYVNTVDTSGTVQVVDVVTGLDDGHQIEIVSGLSNSDRVVDGMIGRLAAGQQVQVEE